jgi:hypothetical protein
MRFKTIDQEPNGDEFAKPRELIEIRGTGGLSLQDRRVMNVLYANAGTSLCDDIDHMIAIAELRGSHKGGERVWSLSRSLCPRFRHRDIKWPARRRCS